MEHTILIVDDDLPSLKAMKNALSSEGHRILEARNGKEAFEQIKDETIHLLLTDLRMPEIGGMKLIEIAKKRNPDIAVVVITGFGSIESAVEAMKRGVDDYLTKPINTTELRILANKVLKEQDLKIENQELRQQLVSRYGFPEIIGHSSKMREVTDLVSRIAPTSATVLITGESGTGKELIARSIHQNSPRRDKTFLALNCSALSNTLIESELFGYERGAFTGAQEMRKGKFEICDGGTLFLDEIGEVDTSTQVKLLRVLEEKEFMRVGGTRMIKVDVRLITATNRDLEKAVSEGSFRRDLYYRLKVVEIKTPPLRERTEDIPLLVDAFIKEFNKKNDKKMQGITPEALNILVRLDYPGNVRELKNLIESAAILSRGEKIGPLDLPISTNQQIQGDSENFNIRTGMSMEEIEQEVIRQTLDRVGGNRTKTAALLKIGLRTLQRKIKNCNRSGGNES
ncbi:MAG: sigma-54 dependent transcriptional regulator [bacterium]